MTAISSVPASIGDRYVDAVEAELRSWLDSRGRVGEHYEMLAYHMGWLDESLQPAAGPRGKRFRPLLCLLACEAVGGSWRDALPLAAAIEFLHNFSLIHDDIEDHDESRHHRPTLWKLCGEPLAINAGDAMLALAGLAALTGAGVPEVARRFQETALALTEGQYLDMSFERRPAVSESEYFRMIGLKTGALITFSCEAGARLGDGTQPQVEGLRSFGRHFGLAFQLHDDIRGIWAAERETGKAAGKDILNRKKSLPVVLALEGAQDERLTEMTRFYAEGGRGDPRRIAAIIEELGVRDAVEGEIRRHVDDAASVLTAVALREPFATQLHELLTKLVSA